MRIALPFLSLLFCLIMVGQCRAQLQAQGIVIDKDTKQRIARVFVYNAENDEGEFNNTKGEFSISAKPGDVLIAAVEGYYPDTLIVMPNKTHIFQLRKTAIRIQEVPIIVRRSPEELLKEKQREYSTAYSKGDRGSLLTSGANGSGLSIDALYRLISREGRNARRLQEIIERDYRESVIDYRFTPELVSRTTGLKGEELADFMQQYRPNYYFVLSANDYNMVFYIRTSYARYLQNPAAHRLPKLPTSNQP